MPDAERSGQGRRNFSRSLARVKRFVETRGAGQATSEEIQRILPDLELLFEKFLKIRSICPPRTAIDLSDEVWMLLARAGVARREIVPLKRVAGSA